MLYAPTSTSTGRLPYDLLATFTRHQRCNCGATFSVHHFPQSTTFLQKCQRVLGPHERLRPNTTYLGKRGPNAAGDCDGFAGKRLLHRSCSYPPKCMHLNDRHQPRKRRFTYLSFRASSAAKTTAWLINASSKSHPRNFLCASPTAIPSCTAFTAIRNWRASPSSPPPWPPSAICGLWTVVFPLKKS